MTRATRVTRDSTALATGTTIGALLAYAFFALVTQKLGAQRAAPVAVLWTYWGACTAIVTFPVQHWIIRTLRAAGDGPIAASLRDVWVSVTAIGILASGASWLVREQLFQREDAAFPLLVGLLTIVTLFGGIVRGGLAGRGRFVATATVLAGENLVRLLLALIVLSIGGGAVEVGLALVAGGFLGLLWPSSYRFEAKAGGRERSSTLEFLGAIATGSLIGQLVLVGGPAVLALLGGAPAEVTALFATLAFFRAPYVLALGLANQVTGVLTELVASGRFKQLKLLVISIGTVGGISAVLVGWLAALVGPRIIGFVFGADTAPTPEVAAMIASGSAFAIGNLALSLLVIARGDAAVLTRAWLVALGVVGAVLFGAPLAPVERVSAGFLSGELVALVVLLPVTWKWSVEGTTDISAGLESEGRV